MRTRTSQWLLTWAERLLLTTGAVLLSLCALAIVERHAAQYFAHETLVAMPRVEPPAVQSRAPRRAPDVGTPLGEISIPRLSLSAVILHGSDARTLRLGVGHIENTALPGDPGNVAIAGHRDTFFSPLQHVRIGDEVRLDTPAGRVRYRVASLRVVTPDDVSVLKPTRDATLTLVTCYPFWVFGHAPDRFIVQATRVDLDADAGAGARPVPIAAPIDAPAAVAASPGVRPEVARARPIPMDDHRLVRQAVERFRQTYNARLDRGERPLAFRGCEIVVNGESATATCATLPDPDERLDVRERIFTLDKAGGVWSIRSVAVAP